MSVESILESIEKLTLLEAAELVKAMEEKFGVSAAAPVAVAAAPAAAAAADGSLRQRRPSGAQRSESDRSRHCGRAPHRPAGQECS